MNFLNLIIIKYINIKYINNNMCVERLKKKDIDTIVKLYNDLVQWSMDKFNLKGGMCKAVVVTKFYTGEYNVELYLDVQNGYWRSLNQYAPANYKIGLSFNNKMQKMVFIKNLCYDMSFTTKTYSNNIQLVQFKNGDNKQIKFDY